MPRVKHVEGLPVLGAGDKRLGAVAHVLFDPSEPRAVALEIERPLLFGVIGRRTRFVPMGEARFVADQAIVTDYRRLPTVQDASARSGLHWDKVVIWRGMPVFAENGEEMGWVRDIAFRWDDGSIKKLMLTEGATADAAVGRVSLPGEQVLGFDGEKVLVEKRAAQTATGGGVATAAGVGTAVAKHVAGTVAGNAARATGKLAGKAAKRARQSAKEWKDLFQGK